MKKIKMRVITWIGLLAVCLLPISARAAGHYQSGIIGQVETPGAYNVIEVFDGRNSIAVLVETDGFFVVDLKPGRYVLTPYFITMVGPGQATPNNTGLQGAAIRVMVTGHHFTFVEIPVPRLPVPPTGVPFLHGPLPVPRH